MFLVLLMRRMRFLLIAKVLLINEGAECFLRMKKKKGGGGNLSIFFTRK